jgi:carboxypeptidase family protein
MSSFTRFGIPVLLCALVASLPAQLTTADVVGKVTDQTGSVVPAAKITITNLGTGLDYTAVADTDGNYRVSLLPAGQYKIQAEKTGFKTWLIQNVSLAIGDK